MVSCVAFGCRNRTSTKFDPQPKLSFFRFPGAKDVERRKKWIAAVRRVNWSPTSSSFLCSMHFSIDQINFTYTSGPRLREGAVPNIFPAYPSSLQEKLMNGRTPNVECEAATNADEVAVNNDSDSIIEFDEHEVSMNLLKAKNKLLVEEAYSLKRDLAKCRDIIEKQKILIARLRNKRKRKKAEELSTE